MAMSLFMTAQKNKKHATAVNPTINAVLKSLYRFANEQQAHDRIAQLKEHFVTSKLSTGENAPNTALIWIRGYALTDAEIAEGYSGHYALISARKMGDKYTLSALKIESELKFHPQKKRPKQKHPDWGHPILRDIKKKRVFASIEEASNELARLHEEFPEVSIPDENKLMIILYEKTPDTKSPVQKYKFAVAAIPEGGFFIDFKRNNKAVKYKMHEGADKATGGGYFTSMVKLKRKKKPTKPAPKAATEE